MSKTFCPSCKHSMRVEEYLKYNECPKCGKQFNSYFIVIGASIFFIIVTLVARKDLQNIDPNANKFTIAFIPGFIILSLSHILLDRLIRKNSDLNRSQRSTIVNILSGALTVLAIFSISLILKNFS